MQAAAKFAIFRVLAKNPKNRNFGDFSQVIAMLTIKSQVSCGFLQICENRKVDDFSLYSRFFGNSLVKAIKA